jgi:hypothetical protein
MQFWYEDELIEQRPLRMSDVMASRSFNEGYRVLEEFACEAIPVVDAGPQDSHAGQQITFLVESITDSGLIVGRAGSKDVPIGSLFTQLQRKSTQAPSMNAGEVQLSLREVHWHGRVVDAVPHGGTAAVAVSGDGLEILASALKALSFDERLWLVGRTQAS